MGSLIIPPKQFFIRTLKQQNYLLFPIWREYDFAAVGMKRAVEGKVPDRQISICSA
jgi:hypothetical protein